MPRVLVDAAVSEDLAVLVEVEFSANQAVGEFARLDRKWTDIASDLLALLVDAAAESFAWRFDCRILPEVIDDDRVGAMRRMR